MELGDMRVAMHTVVQAVKDAVSAIASLASRVAHAGMRVLLKGLGFGGQDHPMPTPILIVMGEQDGAQNSSSLLDQIKACKLRPPPSSAAPETAPKTALATGKGGPTINEIQQAALRRQQRTQPPQSAALTSSQGTKPLPKLPPSSSTRNAGSPACGRTGL